VKHHRHRHILACSCLVLFLGFGWFDSLSLFWDYFFIGSVPVVTQSVDGTQSAAGQDTTNPIAGPQLSAPATTESGGDSSMPWLSEAETDEAATPARI
jgi:hypothetical protein